MPLRRIVGLVVSLVVVLALPAGAQATVRAGSVDDPADMQRPSLSPTYSTDVQHVDVSYDEAGSVQVAVTFFQPERALYAKAVLATSCDVLEDPDQPAATGPAQDAPELSVTLRYHDYSDAEGTSIEHTGYALLAGFDGSAGSDVQLSPDGRTISATFAHAQFAHRDWRCVTGGGGPDSLASQAGDDFAFYLAGYAPRTTITSAVATQALQARLASQYGSTFTASAKKWIKCPREELFAADSDAGPRALCMFDFKAGKAWRYGSATVELDDLRYVTSIGYTRTYSKQTSRCAQRYLHTESYADGTRVTGRKLWAQKLDCRGLPGGAGMVSDIDYMAAARFPRALRRVTVGWHGTNTAGFVEKVRFSCSVRSSRRGRARHYDITCANTLGDKFRYAFDVRRGRA